jgi:translation initiation factor IF-2
MMPSISKLRDPNHSQPVLPPPEPVVTAPVTPPPAVGAPNSGGASAAGTEKPGGESSVETNEVGQKVIHLRPPIIVKDLAAALGLRPFQVIGDLMKLNIFANLNQSVEPEVAAKVCELHGFVFEREKRQKGEGVHKKEEKVVEPPPPPKEELSKQADTLKTRPPVVCFMGHVDHGKTTLMDAIRRTRVAAGEAGGITQHIGAYTVKVKDDQITFLDTPGHAAFTAMRARGANVTDIAVLIVAADDGMMPQTVEALSHARAANVKIVVAITKIDLPGANVDRVKMQLQERDLTPEDWGGDVGVCPVSAVKGIGVQDLLERILLEAEILELKASERLPARCTVIEAEMEQGRGPTASVIVRMGTLRPGDAFICGKYCGKVKSLINDLGKPVKEALPSSAVKVLGFSGLPNAGDDLVVMESDRDVQKLSAERLNEERMGKLAAPPKRVTLESLFQQTGDGQKPQLNVVLKCDVQGSLEALALSLQQIDSRKVDLKIIHSAVGPISETDIQLAAASNAVVLGFGVKVENNASIAAKRESIQVKLYSIIYELIDQVKEAMAGLLEPENREAIVGHAVVKQIFNLTRGVVAGCAVTDGRIVRSARARLLRDKRPIYDGGFATLRRFTEDVKEVRSGFECGIRLGDFSEYEEGDIIQCYTLEKVPQTL